MGSILKCHGKYYEQTYTFFIPSPKREYTIEYVARLIKHNPRESEALVEILNSRFKGDIDWIKYKNILEVMNNENI